MRLWVVLSFAQLYMSWKDTKKVLIRLLLRILIRVLLKAFIIIVIYYYIYYYNIIL